MKRSFSLIKKIFCFAIFLLCASVGHEVYAVGEVDPSFLAGTLGGSNEAIHITAVQSDGKIIVGGMFTSYNGLSRNYITRVNVDGSLDTTFNSSGTGTTGNVYAIAIQSDGKILIGGWLTSYNGTTRNRIARLNTDGSLDTTFDSSVGASGSVYAIAIQSDGKILIGGSFATYNGVSRNDVARLNTDGSLDTTFNPGTGSDGYLTTVKIQSDGKILIGGTFYMYNGTARNRIARLNVNGTLDTTFNPGTGSPSIIYDIAILSDGKFIVGGDFTIFNGTAINRIVRLNANGSIDTTFNPGTGANSYIRGNIIQSNGKIVINGDFTYYDGVMQNCIARINADGSLDTTFVASGTGANRYVLDIALQSDNKIIIGGNFSGYQGILRNRIARLNTDGSLDTSFDPGTGASGPVQAIVIQPDGKIVIGGGFTLYNGVMRNNIARLNTDGSLDTSFDPGTGASSSVQTIAIQPDGKILIGGYFTTYASITRNRITRLNTDGSLDTSFDPGTGANSSVFAIAIQPDGKIVIGGAFTTYNSITYNRIIRLNDNGSLDTTFDSSVGVNGSVQSLVIQPDGKIVIGGSFTTYNGVTRNNIARLNVDGSLDTSFNPGTGPNSTIITITIQPDSKIMIGGTFTNYNGTGRNRVARLNTDGSLDTSFNPGTGANVNVDTLTIQPDGKILIGGFFYSYNNVSIAYFTRLLGGTIVSVPTITTQTQTSVTATAATGNGNITATGGENPSRYIQWGTTSGNYTSSCSAGIGSTGVYSCNLTNLSPNTTYYVRAYATNSAGTGYGTETSFTTLSPTAPVVSTQSATLISPTNATLNANLTNDGGDTCTRQIEYGTATGNYTQTCDAGQSTSGQYVCIISALTQNTTYFYRAKVTNTAGTVYGSEMQFVTGSAIDATVKGNVKTMGNVRVK